MANQRKSRAVNLASVVTRKPESGGGNVVKTNVELVARLHNGQEITIPSGSYVNLDDPRTLPDKLLKEGRIGEEAAAKMRERAKELPDFVKAQLTYVQRSS